MAIDAREAAMNALVEDSDAMRETVEIVLEKRQIFRWLGIGVA